MRLWTLHPKYLDTKGLLALWREGLLAQAVLRGATRGYRRHPQLKRFSATADPPAAIAAYLRAVYEEAAARGYSFDAEKIGAAGFEGRIACTRGQLLYEREHLRGKLKARDAGRYEEIERLASPQAHPIFEIVEGGVEDWEIVPAVDLRNSKNKGGRLMRRNFLPALALLAACALLGACGAHDTPGPSAANANSTTNSNSGAYQGAGPHNAGIGGTGGNANAVSGNTNVEPPGVNKNVRSVNSNSSASNSNH